MVVESTVGLSCLHRAIGCFGSDVANVGVPEIRSPTLLFGYSFAVLFLVGDYNGR